jgi:hypothetical protein
MWFVDPCYFGLFFIFQVMFGVGTVRERLLILHYYRLMRRGKIESVYVTGSRM